MIDYKNSLATYYAKHPRKNAIVYVTEHGMHNSLLTEEGQNNYHVLVKNYKDILKESDKNTRKKKEDDFLLNLNRVEQYPYNEDIKNKILTFLDD